MTEKEHNEERFLVDYLLGRLSPDEEIGLEERYLTDDGLQERLFSVEDELVDDYLEKRLTANERSQFEARFLASPQGRRKLEVAKALRVVATEAAGIQEAPGFLRRNVLHALGPFSQAQIRFAFGAVTLVVAFMLGLWIKERVEHNAGSHEAANSGSHSRPSPAVKPPDQNAGSQSGQEGAIASIVLVPSSRDDLLARKVKIASGTQHLRIELAVESSRKSFTVKLLEAGGHVKWTGRRLEAESTASGRTLVLTLPASLFKTAEYTVILTSNQDPATPIAEYAFIVNRD
jgi:hypothetical protein